MEFIHKPVLLNETISLLRIHPGGTYVDGSVGGGGHAKKIAQELGPAGMLIGMDRDKEACRAAKEHLACHAENVCIIHDNYINTGRILAERGIVAIDGMLLDLGVSSYQLDNAARGFSYMADAPLDMRMEAGAGQSTADIVNTYSESDLCRIIKTYGEERYAKRIAALIVRERAVAKIETTGRLNGIITAAIPKQTQYNTGHPAKRTYQALRIECNQELEHLKTALEAMISLLKPGGRLAIISFHSLEDRLVKQAYKTYENPCVCPKDLPICGCGQKSRGYIVTKRPIMAGEEELMTNSRAKSAKLRVFEKNEKI